jgi:hypothetical protein
MEKKTIKEVEVKTNADHCILILQGRYTWFANHLKAIPAVSKGLFRKEWMQDLERFTEGEIEYALQKSREVFGERMQPMEMLKKLRELATLCRDGKSVIEERRGPSKYDMMYTNHLVNADKTIFDVWNKERLRLSALLSNDMIKRRVS